VKRAVPPFAGLVASVSPYHSAGMRRLSTVLVVGAVGVLTIAGTVAAFWPSGRDESSAESGRQPAVPSTQVPRGSSSQATVLPRCRHDQLALSLEKLGGDQVIVLRHVHGERCHRGGLILSLTVTDRDGESEQVSLASEAGVLDLSGDFLPDFEEVEGFNYLPRCGQRGPFVATARADGYSARRRIAVSPACRRS
jgi:hypothetical protein